jgi:large subunit ribosomal protein L9
MPFAAHAPARLNKQMPALQNKGTFFASAGTKSPLNSKAAGLSSICFCFSLLAVYVPHAPQRKTVIPSAAQVWALLYKQSNFLHRISIVNLLLVYYNKHMQIYLLKDLKGHGKSGDIISLNDGYAKNFVIKNKIGRAVDNAVIAEIKAKQASIQFKTEQETAEIKKIIEKLKSVSVVLSAKVGVSGKMFGSITSAEIAAELFKHGIEIDKKTIVLPEPIKTVGAYKINVKFAHNLHGEILVSIEAANG